MTQTCEVMSWFSLFRRHTEQHQDGCPYFAKGADAFGIILKGKSLEQFPHYADRFDDCFLVNNFDKEIEVIGGPLRGKRCVHFVNRLMTAPMSPENYREYNIHDVQLCKTSLFGDRALARASRHYRKLGLRVHLLPKSLLAFNKDFGKEYAKKYPNTGALAIVYALELLRPKILWIIGLDFYQSDYLIRRSHQNPQYVQREKMKRIRLVEVMASIFKRYPDVAVNMVSYYNGFPYVSNVTILR